VISHVLSKKQNIAIELAKVVCVIYVSQFIFFLYICCTAHEKKKKKNM